MPHCSAIILFYILFRVRNYSKNLSLRKKCGKNPHLSRFFTAYFTLHFAKWGVLRFQEDLLLVHHPQYGVDDEHVAQGDHHGVEVAYILLQSVEERL